MGSDAYLSNCASVSSGIHPTYVTYVQKTCQCQTPGIDAQFFSNLALFPAEAFFHGPPEFMKTHHPIAL